MHGFASILLKVQTFNPDCAAGAIGQINGDLTFTDNRLFELRDLIALWQVSIEIVLAVKDAEKVNFGIKAKACFHGLFDAKLIDDREASRASQHQQRRHVRLALPERADDPEKELGLACDLSVDFKTDDDFPKTRPTFDKIFVFVVMITLLLHGWRWQKIELLFQEHVRL